MGRWDKVGCHHVTHSGTCGPQSCSHGAAGLCCVPSTPTGSHGAQPVPGQQLDPGPTAVLGRHGAGDRACPGQPHASVSPLLQESVGTWRLPGEGETYVSGDVAAFSCVFTLLRIPEARRNYA